MPRKTIVEFKDPDLFDWLPEKAQDALRSRGVWGEMWWLELQISECDGSIESARFCSQSEANQ